ncbi:hypothetical protein ABT063_42475, partial [Streptomyces sp. NPDC002838]|uniref:hypothetical protein n=1 Tax=Streptomyces sp. NPDC002838 TaxID=3154436 RepID=UPI00331A4B5D
MPFQPTWTLPARPASEDEAVQADGSGAEPRRGAGAEPRPGPGAEPRRGSGGGALRGEIRDLDDVLVYFDGITYAMGASVLMQL